MRFTVLPAFALPRHPLLRALAVAAWVVLLAFLLATGLVAGAIIVVVAALVLLLRRWLGGPRHPPAEPDIIEGEYTVIPRSSLPPTH